jgi:AcrR family transcriptional regulator
MFEAESRTQVKRVPRQKRSQTRFESVLRTALRLFAARGYESVSMREIAREAKIPIASVYQYFPMKLAIVREVWSRYTSAISEALALGVERALLEGLKEPNHLVGIIVDRMSELQAANPAFIEIWSCVAASMELRTLNVEDTLKNARMIADALRRMYPRSDADAVFDRALIAIEMASATTRLALVLPEPHRARVLLSLKATVSLLMNPASLSGYASLPRQTQQARRTSTARRAASSAKAATARGGPSSR